MEIREKGSYNTVVGYGVPVPTGNGIVRIGSGNNYLEILADGTVSISGSSDISEFHKALISGVKIVLSMNPYRDAHVAYERADEYSLNFKEGDPIYGMNSLDIRKAFFDGVKWACEKDGDSAWNAHINRE